ncbi:hypothetical protein BB561_000698 [Smittium simulii]|uniref:chitin synthase n=1 Tax=Smittium simulii TaxID=133385 RepID=A0A2T9YXZ8_9FUNG|nr:hypothetical protein BB561_000698 [Smittium simulii]
MQDDLALAASGNIMSVDEIHDILKQRYVSKKSSTTYTKISENVLLTLNQLAPLELNGDAVMQDYIEKYRTSNSENTSAQPHIFDIATKCHFHMKQTGLNQSIVFMGESGSGKTENKRLTLRILSYLRWQSKRDLQIYERILDAEAIIEAFTHAKTTIHSNASRTAIYNELKYDSNGRIKGAQVFDYFFDRKRITNVRPGERNFHIFYYLLYGTSDVEKTELGLFPLQYEYLCQPETIQKLVGIDDLSQLTDLKQSMQSLGLGKVYTSFIFKTLTTILLLGNIQFEDPKDNTAIDCAAIIKTPELCSAIAEFLGVETADLINALIYKSQLIGKEMCTIFLNANNAKKQRDDHVIGILDIPGFHGSHICKFEELLYNYFNERVFHFMNHQIYQAGNSDYISEEINDMFLNVEYNDNTACLDLYMWPKTGLFSIMKDETVFEEKLYKNSDMIPNAIKDLNLALKFNEKNAKQKNVFTSKTKNEFSISHFMGNVTYSTQGFLESNKDSIPIDFIHLLNPIESQLERIVSSVNPFISNLFNENSIVTDIHPKIKTEVIKAHIAFAPNISPTLVHKKENSSKKKHNLSIVGIYQKGVNRLIAALNDTLPWFVINIKTSENINQKEWDSAVIKNQLENFGVAKIAARKNIDFTISLLHSSFVERYVTNPLGEDALNNADNDIQNCENCKIKMGFSEKDMTIGKNKVFLSYSSWHKLEFININRQKIKELDNEDCNDHINNNQSNINNPNGHTQNCDELLSIYSDDENEDIALFDENTDSELKNIILKNQIADQMREISNSQKMQERLGAAGLIFNPEKNQFCNEELDNKNKTGELSEKILKNYSQGNIITESADKKNSFEKNQKEQRTAWREKFTLCFMIAMSCIMTIFWIAVVGIMICPKQNVYTVEELNGYNTAENALISIRGQVFSIKNFNHFDINYKYLVDNNYPGKDLSDRFPFQLSFVCPGFNIDPRLSMQPKPSPYSETWLHDQRYWKNPDMITNGGYNHYQYRLMRIMRTSYLKGNTGMDLSVVKNKGNGSSNSRGQKQYLGIINNEIFDLSDYINYSGVPYSIAPTGVSNNTEVRSFLSNEIVNMFATFPGADLTQKWDAYFIGNPELKQRYYTCFKGAFFSGIIDKRKSFQCYFANYILLASSVILTSVVFFKFIAALQLSSRREPEENDNFVICNVPCYTEGEDSLRLTLESLAKLHYDDKKKLLFVICDGMIMGAGNDRTTPQIVLDTLGADPSLDPSPLSYHALGEGQKQHNRAKVYSGLFEVAGHVVPYIVVVKCGTSGERIRQGNRGKRDSQIILMKFFNKAFFDLEMTPLELEIFHQIKNIIGVNPVLYEFVMMVDADTYVFPDSLNRMVSCMIHDTKLMGLCGETMLANEKETWVTMVQVYEYYISHHLSKAFESLFGSVTCLPGCFCMYRIRSAEKNQPLLINPAIIKDYSENVVDTLHKKNLLHLGEDRYLTTLMLKHLPYYKTKFTPDAQCRTNAPDTWSVLLSQRRRWINSTVHNLFELVVLPRLCGFCCFSMRFIVFIDLLSTIIMPATVGYLAYLVYVLITWESQIPIVSICLLSSVYAMQVFLFVIKRQWQHIGWMIVYIFAIPVFSLFIPLYSFWHFDDFSWGNTRLVVGENKKQKSAVESKHFDPSTVPTKKWDDYENDVLNQPQQHTGSEKTDFQDFTNNERLYINSRVDSPAFSLYSNSNYGYHNNTNTMFQPNLGQNTRQMINQNVNPIISNTPIMCSSPIQAVYPVNDPLYAQGFQRTMSPMHPIFPISHPPVHTQMPMYIDPNIYARTSYNNIGSHANMQQNVNNDMFMAPYNTHYGINTIENQTANQSSYIQNLEPANMHYNQYQNTISNHNGLINNSIMNVNNFSDKEIADRMQYNNYIHPNNDLPHINQQEFQIVNSEMPNSLDKELLKTIKNIIQNSDLETLTKKQVRNQVATLHQLNSDQQKSLKSLIDTLIEKAIKERV